MLSTMGPLMPRFVSVRRYRFSFESVRGVMDNDNALVEKVPGGSRWVSQSEYQFLGRV